mgnify:CR=1 FL=1
MTQQETEFQGRAQRALDKLVERYIYDPDVTFIDAGYAPATQDEATEDIVLRIHVRERWLNARPEERTAFPEQVDGIPVIVVPADFHLETNTPIEGE